MELSCEQFNLFNVNTACTNNVYDDYEYSTIYRIANKWSYNMCCILSGYINS